MVVADTIFAVRRDVVDVDLLLESYTGKIIGRKGLLQRCDTVLHVDEVGRVSVVVEFRRVSWCNL